MAQTFSCTPDEKALYQLCREKVAPGLIAYVHWVLDQAEQRGIRTLYFLARDGYILMQIAQHLCAAEQREIDCRYLYCSRRALRLPSYHLLGDEAYDLLFSASRHFSLNEVFQRANLTKEQRESVLAELGVSEEAAMQPLTPASSDAWKQHLQSSSAFRSALQANSEHACQAVTAYFHQEKLFDQPTVALVDSGWAGSSQRSIRQLLSDGGYTGSITGFYFGLIRPRREAADGEYVSWLFGAKTHYWRKVLFNLNVFECLLSAPHGMTMTYALENGQAVPQLAPPPEEDERRLIQAKNAGILDALQDAGEKDWRSPDFHRRALRKLHALMAWPCAEDVRCLSSFAFSDDIGAEKKSSMVGHEQSVSAWDCFVLTRLWRKVHHSPKEANFRPFWSCGTAALIPGALKRGWFRVNALLWEMLKYMG